MAINSKYEELLNFQIQYKNTSGVYDLVSTGIRLVPTINTRKKFRQGHLVFRDLKRGGILFFRAKDDSRNPFVELSQGTLLTFIIQLDDKNEFFKITDLSTDYDRSKIILFKNDPSVTIQDANAQITNSQSINHIIARAPTTRLFNYQFEVSGNPSTVNLKVENTLLEFNNLPNINNKFTQQLDMRNFENGKYKMLITPTQEEEIYVDDDLAAVGIIGLVEITLPAIAYATTKHKYTLTFIDKT